MQKTRQITIKRITAAILAALMLSGILPGGFFESQKAQAQMSQNQKTDINAVAISSGSNHMAILDDRGQVWTWANENNANYLGRPTSTTATAENYHAKAALVTLADGSPLPAIKQISCGWATTVCLDTNGDVWTWGSAATTGRTGTADRPGKVTFGDGTAKIQYVTGAYNGGKAVDTNGRIWVWSNHGGTLYSCELGTGTAAVPTTPVMLTTDASGASLSNVRFKAVESSDYFEYACAIALTEDGKIYTWGNYEGIAKTAATGGSIRPKLVPNTPNDIKKIDASNGAYGFLTESGELWSWGDHGQLRATTGTNDARGRLALGHNTTDVAAPTQITNPNVKFKDFSIYAWSILALDENGTLYGAGQALNEKHGALGVKNLLTPFTIENLAGKIIKVSEGLSGSLYLDNNGNAYAEGDARLKAGGTIAEPWVHLPTASTPLIYKQTEAYFEGVKASDPDFKLYPPQLIPGTYGIYLNADGTNHEAEPPQGWDIVQPDPKQLEYWQLEETTPGQTELEPHNPASKYQHRLDATKEIVLNSAQMAGDPTTKTPRVTFTYVKTPDKWADTTLYFVNENGTPVPVTENARTSEYIKDFAPIATIFTNGQDPYTPPQATDPSAKPVGYKTGTPPTESDYTPCTFPEGFCPVISADNEPIYIIYQTEASEATITIKGASTDGKLNYEYSQTKSASDTFEVKAWEIPTYRVTGYTETDSQGAILSQGTADAVTITPSRGNSTINFTYVSNEAAPAPTPTPAPQDTHEPYLYGYPDGTVKPDAGITRAELAVILHRIITDEHKNAPQPNKFTDVTPGTWYEQAINYLAAGELLTGYPDGTIKPDHPVTRAESVAIINRMLERTPHLSGLPTHLHNYYTDIKTEHWAFADILEASVSHKYTKTQSRQEIWTIE